MDRKDLFFNYALNFLGTPYIWGGNNILEGLDCSGFMCEILRAFGLLGRSDANAQTIFATLELKGWANAETECKGAYHPGSVLFFGKDRKMITHVALAITSTEMIEAGGGNSKTLTAADAKKTGACIRIRPISNRKDFIVGIKLPL